MPNVPQARARPHGKLDRPKMGKQMHELLTRGKVPPQTVTLLVSLRRQCKGAMYEPDAVVMMQQGTIGVSLGMIKFHRFLRVLCDAASVGTLWHCNEFAVEACAVFKL